MNTQTEPKKENPKKVVQPDVNSDGPGFAPEGEPKWAPPEAQPEAFPAEPVMSTNQSPLKNP